MNIEKCEICGQPAAADNDKDLSALCEKCTNFLTKHAPLSVEAHMYHFQRQYQKEAAAMLKWLQTAQYEYEDESYF